MGTIETRLCHDCGAKEGELHQRGCDMERCPLCGGQLISCRCRRTPIDRIPWVQIPNFCGLCGLTWPKMFHVPDEEWNKFIIPELQGEGLCVKCYHRMKKLFPNGWKQVKKVNHASPLS